MKAISIKIQEPCSENWNNMTPTQKGAFCQSCAKEVTDYSKMSLDEIKQSVINNQEHGQHTCIRIKNSQLAILNQEYDQYSFRSTKSFQSAFALSLLIVFGLSLFSCQEEKKPEIEKFREEVKISMQSDQTQGSYTLGSPLPDVVEPIEEIINFGSHKKIWGLTV